MTRRQIAIAALVAPLGVSQKSEPDALFAVEFKSQPWSALMVDFSLAPPDTVVLTVKLPGGDVTFTATELAQELPTPKCRITGNGAGMTALLGQGCRP